ncbi:MAG: hypothetical protein KOO63_09670 [Bacteroidales bacterium]|nr:hypothetical protein [Candidatus Latescibacterota bacterium]
MAEKVTIREDLQIIQVDSYGDVNAEDLKKSLETVFKIRQEQGLTRVLVDATRETSLPSTPRVFEFGSQLAELLRGMKFALATSPETDRDLRFLVTVAINRGAQVSVFDSVDDALVWLMEDPG